MENRGVGWLLSAAATLMLVTQCQGPLLNALGPMTAGTFAAGVYTGCNASSVAIPIANGGIYSMHGVIVDCQGSGSAFVIDSLDSVVTIRGLTVMNAHGTGTIEGIGAAIALLSGLITFEDCVFANNVAAVSGGALATSPNSVGGYVHFVRCNFTGNSAPYGSAVFCRVMTMVFTACILEGNVATSNGNSGATLSFNSCGVQIENSVITDNVGFVTASIFGINTNINVTSSLITGNTVIGSVAYQADMSANAICLTGSSYVTMANVIITNNTGAHTTIRHLGTGGTVYLVDVTIAGNSYLTTNNNTIITCGTSFASVVNVYVLGTSYICDSFLKSPFVGATCSGFLIAPAYVCVTGGYPELSRSPSPSPYGKAGGPSSSPAAGLSVSTELGPLETVAIPVVSTIVALLGVVACVIVGYMVLQRKRKTVRPTVVVPIRQGTLLNTPQGVAIAMQDLGVSSIAGLDAISLHSVRSPAGASAGVWTPPSILSGSDGALAPPHQRTSGLGLSISGVSSGSPRYVVGPSSPGANAYAASGPLAALGQSNSSMVDPGLTVQLDDNYQGSRGSDPSGSNGSTRPLMRPAQLAIPPPRPHRQLPSSNREDWMIRPEDLEVCEIVGEGAFGTVYRGLWRGASVAVKVVRVGGRAAALADFQAEARTMARLHPHPNVVQFLGLCQSGNTLSIVSGYIPGGSLLSLINSDAPLPVNEKLSLAQGVAAGMLHLSSEGVVHRDLAARNILIETREGQRVPLICDFGMSRIGTDNGAGVTQSDMGPVKWMAPECLVRHEYSHRSDAWAFGVLLFEIFTRETPYKNVPLTTVAVGVVNRTVKLQASSKTVPDPIQELIEACMTFEPDARPDQRAIYSHLMALGRAFPGDRGGGVMMM